MKVLVTGGAGFIGSHIVHAAADAGHEVVVIDDLSSGLSANIDGMGATFVHGSLLDRSLLDVALDGVESVVHLAAIANVPASIANPRATHEANVTGTLNLLESASRHGVAHVITASSSSVYGLNPALPVNERSWARPLSPYGVSKLAAEQYTLAWQQCFGTSTVAFRFFNVYGPRQRADHAYAAVIPTFIEALLTQRALPLHGDGRQSRDFTYVGTVTAVVLDTIERKLSYPEPVNLASGTPTTVCELIDTLASVTGLHPIIDRLPARTGDVPYSSAQTATMHALFPELLPVPLAVGLRDTVEWFRDNL